ncbi:dihydroxyacetone kinase family protein [Jonesiaceae bacterium BS-20]|uniref:Dihydroxyacetone kinase family protein n=1 Tax=Jonesiaceae bacterium BS-20 TaxID=3120821 RepID=A0AAU7DWI4_9MICO
MRKIMNAADAFVDESLEGIMLAHPQSYRAASEDGRAVVRVDAGTGHRVGIVTGGGSGHLPLFLGYVGHGLASGVGVGNVFSSPSAKQLYAATMASNEGRGVLYLYGNYGGDVYNFDLAATLAAQDGVETATVVGTDDVLSAPMERAADRRGVAGLFFVMKIAGAKAQEGADLETVREIAERANGVCRTMGVGLAPTILPAAGEPTFTLNDGEMEVGIGIHGEPGHHRGPLEPADEIAQRFLTEIVPELELSQGSRVAVLVNGMGATPLEELYILYRKVHLTLLGMGVEIVWKFVGELVTSLEMVGASLSVIVLDDEMQGLLDAPAHSPFFSQGVVPQATRSASDKISVESTDFSEGEAREVRRAAKESNLRAWMLNVVAQMPRHSDELRNLDAAVGDGDLGVTIALGSKAILQALQELPSDAHPVELIKVAGSEFAAANPSTFAALVGGGLVTASSTFEDEEQHSTIQFAQAIGVLQQSIMDRGKAQVGDKTVVDILDAARRALLESTDSESSVQTMERVQRYALEALESSRGLSAKLGRAGWLGDRTKGHLDPGSVAFLRLLEEVQAALKE